MSKVTTDEVSARRDMTLIRVFTSIIHRLRELESLYVHRRADTIWRLRTAGVTYEQIAIAMGTSAVAVHKAIQDRLYKERVSGVEEAEEEAEAS